jgi:hypothetical protein
MSKVSTGNLPFSRIDGNLPESRLDNFELSYRTTGGLDWVRIASKPNLTDSLGQLDQSRTVAFHVGVYNRLFFTFNETLEHFDKI